MPKRRVITGPILAWFFYDWANSAFPSIITTFVFATYFTEKVAVNKIIGTAQWGDAIAIAGILIAILSPLLGAIADNEGRRKPWLAVFSIITIIAAALLWNVEPNPSFAHLAMICVIIGTIGLEIGMVFYNSMLSDLAPPDYVGRLSGWSWGFGYFGGIFCLLIALFVFVEGRVAWLGLSTNTAEHIRFTGPLVAIWFLVFGWPIFAFTPDQPSTGLGIRKSIKKGMKSLLQTLLTLKQYREIMKFLLARLIYIDGLNTIFAFGGIYAAGVLHMSFTEVIQFGIALNVGAGIGAALFAWLDDYKGAKLTILISLVIMMITGTGMLLTHSKSTFWFLGMTLSLCVGPVQSASRSLMIRLAPKHMVTEMFGLFAFSGKITAFLGPWILGMLTMAFHSQRVGMSTVIFFLFAGALILSQVKAQ